MGVLIENLILIGEILYNQSNDLLPVLKVLAFNTGVRGSLDGSVYALGNTYQANHEHPCYMYK